MRVVLDRDCSQAFTWLVMAEPTYEELMAAEQRVRLLYLATRLRVSNNCYALRPDMHSSHVKLEFMLTAQFFRFTPEERTMLGQELLDAGWITICQAGQGHLVVFEPKPGILEVLIAHLAYHKLMPIGVLSSSGDVVRHQKMPTPGTEPSREGY